MPALLKAVVKGLVSLAIASGAAWAMYASVQYKPAEKAQQQRRPGTDFAVPVTAATAAKADVPVYFDGVGTAKALNTVLVRPQVDGKIMQLAFKEGQEVKKGQLIAKIDPTQYQTLLEQAQAKKSLTEATLANARRDLERYASVSAGIVAIKTIDTQKALVVQTTAQLKADEAAIANARAYVDWTNVTSPLDGRTGIRLVDEGNLVRAGDAGIVTISQIRPITVQFTLPQQQLASINRAIAGGALSVEAVEADGRTVIDRGALSVIDNQVDQTTGTVRFKAELPNARTQLWPGQFVNIRLLVETQKGVVTVPTQAVQRGPSGPFVYAIGAEDKVAVRPVMLGLQTETVSVVAKGVEVGERVVTAGFGRLKDGAKVQAEPPDAGKAGGPPTGRPPGTGAPSAEAGGAGKSASAAAGAATPTAGAGDGKTGGGGGDVRTACRADSEKYCATAERGEARRACMLANQDKLSDGCQTALRAAFGGATGGSKP